MNKKEYRTDVQQRPQGPNFLSYTPVVAVATVTFQDGGYFGFKGIYIDIVGPR